jgi:hypothetical protein
LFQVESLPIISALQDADIDFTTVAPVGGRNIWILKLPENICDLFVPSAADPST